jgi:hypothetical protein
MKLCCVHPSLHGVQFNGGGVGILTGVRGNVAGIANDRDHA